MSDPFPILDDELLRNYTGQTEVRTVNQANAIIETFKPKLQKAQADAKRINHLVWYRKSRLLCVKFNVSPEIAALIVASIGVTVVSGILILCNAPLIVDELAVVFSFIVGGGLVYWLLADRGSETEDVRGEIRDRQCRQTIAEQTLLLAVLTAHTKTHDAARSLRDKLKLAATSECARLLAVDFRSLDGGAFESFLADVFRQLGYAVHQTGRSGDQGVDLIVERNGVKTAVQAKCYQDAVSISAIQEVYTGKALYRCHNCMAITSSQFTRGAKEAAAGLGCRLITGNDLPLLIRGKLL